MPNPHMVSPHHGEVRGRTPADEARRLLAEAVGTYFLVVVGCGAIVLDRPAAAVAFFLVVLALIGGLGHISGAHFNPAVSLSFLLTGRLSGRRFLSYAVVQSIGAVLAGYTLRAIWPDRPANLGATVPTIGAGRAALVEAVLTALLMLVIASVATDARAVGVPAGLAIAAVVGATSVAFGPLTGASLNPARSLGPALAAGQWGHFWVYLLGPGVGAVAGGYAYEILRGNRDARVDR